MATTEPITVGNCSSVAASSLSSFIGASEAPKSTVRLTIWF